MSDMSAAANVPRGAGTEVFGQVRAHDGLHPVHQAAQPSCCGGPQQQRSIREVGEPSGQQPFEIEVSSCGNLGERVPKPLPEMCSGILVDVLVLREVATATRHLCTEIRAERRFQSRRIDFAEEHFALRIEVGAFEQPPYRIGQRDEPVIAKLADVAFEETAPISPAASRSSWRFQNARALVDNAGAICR